MRKAVWGDFVPLGFYPTWAMQPNLTLKELDQLLENSKRHLFERPNALPARGTESRRCPGTFLLNGAWEVDCRKLAVHEGACGE